MRESTLDRRPLDQVGQGDAAAEPFLDPRQEADGQKGVAPEV